MPKPLDPKCQLCAKLTTAKAKVLHGTSGDGCWNPKVSRSQSFPKRALVWKFCNLRYFLQATVKASMLIKYNNYLYSGSGLVSEN